MRGDIANAHAPDKNLNPATLSAALPTACLSNRLGRHDQFIPRLEAIQRPQRFILHLYASLSGHRVSSCNREPFLAMM
jgi:hypothetical protein